MTIGNKNYDRRQFVTHPDSPTVKYKVGAYGTCSWSGSNSPGKPYRDNPYLKTASDKNDPWIVWRRKKSSAKQYGSMSAVLGSDFFSLSGLVSPWSSNDTIALINKLEEKITGSEFNPSVFLAEASPALNMISDNVSALAKAIRKVKKGDVIGAARALSVSPKSRNKNASRSADETSSRWLELQYGWLPLLGDTKNAAEHVASLIEKPQKKTYRVSKQRGTYKDSVYHDYVNVALVNNEKRWMLIELRNLPNPSKLSLVDPAIVAWELMPYSFVADWFLPIGDYLGAQKIRSTLDIKRVVTSMKQWRSRRVTGYTGSSYNGGYVSINQGELQAFTEYVRFERQVSTTLPDIPFPNVRSLDEAFSYRRCANAIALAYQAFK